MNISGNFTIDSKTHSQGDVNIPELIKMKAPCIDRVSSYSVTMVKVGVEDEGLGYKDGVWLKHNITPARTVFEIEFKGVIDES